MAKICRCGREVEEARIKLLNSDRCSICAARCGTTKKRAIQIWHHKTAPELQIVSEDTYNQYKKDTYRRGAGSILRNKSPKQGAPL